MKRYLTFVAFLATTILATASPETELLQSKTTALWQAFKDKKGDDFKKLCSPDYRSLYAEGPLTVQQELENMNQIELKSFSLSAFNVVMWNPDSALVTYKARADGSASGEDISGDYNVGTVWQKTNGEWRAVFHSEIKAMPAG